VYTLVPTPGPGITDGPGPTRAPITASTRVPLPPVTPRYGGQSGGQQGGHSDATTVHHFQLLVIFITLQHYLL